VDAAEGEEILRAAVDVFAQRGYRGTSIDDIADRAGLSRQDVLRRYRSKQRLLTAMLDLRDELNRRQGSGDGEYARVPERFAQAMALDQDEPALARAHSVMMADAAAGVEPARTYVSRRREALQVDLTRRLTEMAGERLPSGLEPAVAAAAVLALVEGVHQQWLVDPEGGPYPQVIQDTLTVLLGTDTRT
jgi:AcrR family transcriptional regulator